MKNQNNIFTTILLALGFLAVCPMVHAALNPPPDGGYPHFTTAEGQSALNNLTTGIWNTALGGFTLFSDTSGSSNTAVGLNALRNNMDGSSNVAVGIQALFANVSGTQNCAFGNAALFANTQSGCTAVGWGALALNDASGNTAVGTAALVNNTTAQENTAVGFEALLANVNGGDNTATGFAALGASTASFNTAFGDRALGSLAGGGDNTAIGWFAGAALTGGEAGNIYIGSGVTGVAGESLTIRIGGGFSGGFETYIDGIYGVLQPQVGMDPDFVTIRSDGRLGRAGLSSRRYKHDIKPMDKASEVLYTLKPVSFRYNKELDATQTIAFGLIAEDVAKVAPNLVGRNREGRPETVRYEQINAMLLNEFLKEHKKVEEQQVSIAELKSTVAQQQKGMEVLIAQLKEQAAQIQKVSAQLEVSKPATSIVLNRP